MTKQKLAQKRNYFKFVLLGMSKPVDISILTDEEKQDWYQIKHLREKLLTGFDDNSRSKGLNVPEHKCMFFGCKNKVKYYIEEDNIYMCKKHYNEYLKETK